MMQDVVLFQGKHLRVIRRGNWEFVERVDTTHAVVILAITDAREVLLVEQYREPLKKRVIEFPAGLIGDGGEREDAETAAKRELLEETGFAARQWETLMSGPPSAGLSTELVTVVRASGLTKTDKGGGIEGEKIIVHQVPMTGVAEWLEGKRHEGLLIDPKIYAGLFFASR